MGNNKKYPVICFGTSLKKAAANDPDLHVAGKEKVIQPLQNQWSMVGIEASLYLRLGDSRDSCRIAIWIGENGDEHWDLGVLFSADKPALRLISGWWFGTFLYFSIYWE